MGPRLLVVVFEPDASGQDAAHAAVHEVARTWDEASRDLVLDVLTVPRSYARAAPLVLARLRETRPQLFLLYDTDLTSEDYVLHQLAANYDDDPRPDVDGVVRQATIIDPNGPVAFRGRLPFDGVWDKFLVERVPVRMGHKATHVFNHVYYQALRMLHDEGLATRGGAILTPPRRDPRRSAEGRTAHELAEETVMVLAVLRHLYPALLRSDPAE